MDNDNGINELRQAVIKKFNSVVGLLREDQLTTLHELFQHLEHQVELDSK